MKECKIKNLYNLDETIASKIFEGATYPWEVLPKIEQFIIELGNTLNPDEYNKIGEDIWIAKSATVAPTWTCNYRKKCRNKTLCFYKRKSNSRRRGSSRKLNRIKKCNII